MALRRSWVRLPLSPPAKTAQKRGFLLYTHLDGVFSTFLCLGRKSMRSCLKQHGTTHKTTHNSQSSQWVNAREPCAYFWRRRNETGTQVVSQCNKNLVYSHKGVIMNDHELSGQSILPHRDPFLFLDRVVSHDSKGSVGVVTFGAARDFGCSAKSGTGFRARFAA